MLKTVLIHNTYNMATIKLYLDARVLNKNGSAPLKLAVRNKNEVAYLSLGISVPPSCWKNGKVYAGRDASRLTNPPKIMNQKIANIYAKCELAYEKECGLRSNISARVLRDKILILLKGEEQPEETRTLESLFKEVAENSGSTEKTIRRFMASYKKLLSIIPSTKTMSPELMDTKYVEKFYDGMRKDGLRDTTISLYLQKLRTVYNYAVRKGLCHPNENPFKSKKLKTNYSVVHRNIPIDEFRIIWNTRAQDLNVPKPASIAKVAMALDIFKLMFCLCGLNLKDLVRLTDKDIINGRIETYRAKTNTRVSIKLEPEALELIKRLRKGDRLIGRALNSKTYESFIELVNRRLSSVSPELTTYYARHTWATLAFDLDIPDHVIAMGLSHSYQTRNTNMFYINNDYKKLDVANRKILDYVKGEIEL